MRRRKSWLTQKVALGVAGNGTEGPQEEFLKFVFINTCKWAKSNIVIQHFNAILNMHVKLKQKNI